MLRLHYELSSYVDLLGSEKDICVKSHGRNMHDFLYV